MTLTQTPGDVTDVVRDVTDDVIETQVALTTLGEEGRLVGAVIQPAETGGE